MIYSFCYNPCLYIFSALEIVFHYVLKTFSIKYLMVELKYRYYFDIEV